jgi:hypothetical protein
VRKYWLTLGTILAGMYGVSTLYQTAVGQDGPPSPVDPAAATAPVAVPTPTPTIVTVGPGGATATLSAPSEGSGVFTYSAPSSFAVFGGGDGEAMSEEMVALIQKDAELEAQVQQIVAEYTTGGLDSSVEGELRKKLTDLLDAQFTARQARREMEIKQIEDRVHKLREALDRRSSAKEKIIERRLNDLLTDAEGLGWGEAAQGQFTYGLGGGRGAAYGPSGSYGPTGPGRGMSRGPAGAGRGGSGYGPGRAGGAAGGYGGPSPSTGEAPAGELRDH